MFMPFFWFLRAMRAMRGKTLETVPFQPYCGCTKSFLKVLSNYYCQATRAMRANRVVTAPLQPYFGKKGGFQKGGLADVPRERNPERGYIRMFPRNDNRNEGTLACSHGTKTERGYLRQNQPFTKPPFLSPNVSEPRTVLVCTSVSLISDDHTFLEALCLWRILGVSVVKPLPPTLLRTPDCHAFFSRVCFCRDPKGKFSKTLFPLNFREGFLGRLLGPCSGCRTRGGAP